MSPFSPDRIFEIVMQVVTEYLGANEFALTARGHRVISDQPVEKGGSDKGMTPPELFLGSLGACAAFYAAQYLNARSLPSEGLSVRVEANLAKQPSRLDAFRIEIDVPVLDERHREGVLRAAKACLLHNTLAGVPPVAIEVKQIVPVAA